MKILKEKLAFEELKKMAAAGFGDMVKVVVDLDRELIAINADLHSDLEALLLENGSRQENIWGINLYPELSTEEFLEFDSMINVRPTQGNRSRGVDSEEKRRKIAAIVKKWIPR